MKNLDTSTMIAIESIVSKCKELSKRDIIAMVCMNGIISHDGMKYEPSVVAKDSYLMADSMIKEGSK